METSPVTQAERELIDSVVATNEERFDDEFFDGAHIVAAGVRTADGAVYQGVSLPASIGRASVCAEPVAIGSAIADGHSHDDIESCVAVAYPMSHHEEDESRTIPPCGVCREMLLDYNEEMRVIVPVDGENRAARAVELLQNRPW